ncbi:ABC transporter ATP-binding protein [Alkalibacterium olivapovliticus]|uniref:Oligopeptide transport system ATP-binding protein n=1 Tax=Alkalibacterium olivapovliticus TaxID=99907 RepID=A0A2T0W2C9_9LACT|nr:ATP-binding cassette domain-containing protein [Alkalibacterium olivapovliticus]PRY79339.1 oligopeptide transport system ATP-binding protein [Alkalibacterium olivapovliticus]
MAAEPKKRKPIVEIKEFKQYFNAGKKSEVRAVKDVSFSIYEGETFGLVGESGSGKSTTGRALIKLGDLTGGQITYKGQDISGIKRRKDLLKFRKSMQMIFQDPYASLNPRLTVKEIIGGALKVHGMSENSKERTERVYELLESVGLNRQFANRYPKEFSGGQCQRVGIARALAVEPDFIICDEAISALDVSIQAQVINLLIELKESNNLTYLFIAHDLSMVKYISDRIGVMNNGRILEVCEADELYIAPLHPYTESLLSAIPTPDPETERSRVRTEYDPAYHHYDDLDNVRLHEIAPEHYIYCHKDEVALYRKKREKLLKKAKQYA